MNAVAPLSDPRRVAALLGHPLRTRIVALAREPASASELAQQLRLSRQRVNYHVRTLARTGFLRRAGQIRKRNLIEQRYVATARAYVLAPEVLGPLAASGHTPEDAFSALRLIGLAGEVQAQLSRAMGESARLGRRLATLSLAADLRFESPAQRQQFAEALQDAVATVIARHSSPARPAPGAAATGRGYRLIVGCYPATPKRQTAAEET